MEVTRANLGSQLRSPSIGWSAAIEPVPASGRLRFAQIGNLARLSHEGARAIDLADPNLQQMINKEDKKPISAEDFKGAIWAWGKKINQGEDLPPPKPDEWMCGYIKDFAGSRSSAAFNEAEQALQLIADTRSDAQANWGKYNETALVYYVGKIPAGTKIRAEVTIACRNQEPYGVPVYANVRGWQNGWFDGDWHEYLSFSKNPRYSDYEDKSGEFVVLDSFSDIWVTCEVRSNEPRYSAGEMNIGLFKNWKLSLA